MSGEHREVPSDLITHNPKEHNAPIEATASGEVPLENMDNAPGANVNAPTQSIYTPNKTGLISAGVATPVAITGQKVVGAGNWIMDKLGKPSLQTYANSQIGDRNLNIPVKDLQKLTGLPVPVTNPALVQRASKIISGREAVPDTFKEIYTVDPVTGKQTLSHVEKTPGAPEVAPLDPNKLKPYEKNAKYYAKKHGELPLRTGVAAYNIGKGLSEENKLVGGAEVGAGVAMGAAPWLPKNVKGIPLRAIATGLGLIPGASEAIGSASAEPLDIPGMAIDYGMGLMAPSTLGDATLHKNPRYTPGMSVLHGSTLPPEMRAQGGLIHLADGGQPELGTAQAYEPSYSEKIRDYAAKHIGREHANRLFGGANARVEDNFNPISMALQTPGAIADAATGFVKAGQEGDYLGGMGNYLMGAMNVAPMLKPGAQAAKSVVKNLGPKAADMAEGYLSKIGGIQYAVPPTKHSISQIPQVAQALEEYLKGNITKEQQMAVTRKYLPIRQWNELPPYYTRDEVTNALTTQQRPKAFVDVPAGMQTGNRLDIKAYEKDPSVYVDTVHDSKGKPFSYNRTGHSKDVTFSSKPNTFYRVGLGTKPQALTPMGVERGMAKTPQAMMKGTNVGTHDEEVRRMMAEMLQDPAYTQIGMDPRVGSQFYDKATDRPIWTSGEKLQSGPLVIVPKKDIETTSWNDPRLLLEDFPGKTFSSGGEVQGYAGGKSVVAEGAIDLAKKASGYLHHTNINPNPLVGTRFETKDLGGLAPVKDMSLEDIRGHMIHSKPWDLTSRNQQIVSVSGKPITTDIVTHGGQPYVRDLEHMKQDIGGASAFPISNRIQKITNISSKEGEKLGGTGQVTMTPSTMSQFSEDYAIPTFDTYKNLWDQAEPGAARTQALLEKLKFASPKTLKTETPIPFAGMVKDVKYPFQDLKSLDFNDPDVAGRFMQTPDLRKALIKEWRSKENQKMMGYNAEDLSAAHTDPNLRNIPPAYAGHTMIEMQPGAKPTLSSNITYDTDFAGNYLGSVGHTPTPVLLNKSYSKINDEMRQLHPDANEDALHRLTMGALYTRNHGVSDLVNDEMINRVGAYHEGVKQNKIDPNDVQGALQYLSKPGAYNEGGSVESFAPGGKVGAAKKLFEEAQAAYKAKFTPGFLHNSPSPSITAFDPTKGDRAFPTEGVTFGTRDPKFGDSFFDMHKNKAGKFEYNKGSTSYPISINLGKHFVPGSPEGSALIDQYIAKMAPNPDAVLSPAKRAAALKAGAWDVMEDPNFLQHLRDTGHNTFTVMEGGVPNVGVFNPADIRGKFAKFNPEHAANPDFMKAKGGLV